MNLRVVWLIVALAVPTGTAGAQTFKREELRVPAPGSGPRGLQVLLVKPDLPGRLPLVVISHGSPLKPEDRRLSRPHLYLPHAIEFARRGWAAAIVMRRGFGDSGGEYGESPGPCTQPDHVSSSTRASADIRVGIAFLQRRPDIDSTRLLAVGQSTGGVLTIALTIDPPPGLLAAINFAGGVIPTNFGKPCKNTEDRLVEAFKVFGKRSRVPMLWVYSQNDQLFPPKLVQQLMNVFSAGGGKAELIQAPPFRNDGHSMFAYGIRQWTPYIDQFLKQQELVILAEPLPRPAPVYSVY
jgi:dienelactone hydrolase